MNYMFEIQPFSSTPTESIPTDPALALIKQKALLKIKKASKKKVKASSYSWSRTE